MFNTWKRFKERLKFNSRDNIRNRTFIAQRIVKGNKEYRAAVCYKNFKGDLEYELLEIHVADDVKDSSVCVGGCTYWTYDKDAVKYALDNFIKLNEDHEEKEPEIAYGKYP